MSFEPKIQAILDNISKNLDNPRYEHRFKDFNRIIQFEIEGTDEKYVIYIKNLKANIKEGNSDQPDILISGKSETVEGIINGEINAITAVMSRGLTIKGKMADIMDLKKLLALRR